MPLYDFKCPCGNIEEVWAKMDEKTKPCECGQEMKRLITSQFNIDADFASTNLVTDNITGEPVRITSKRQLRNLCQEHGVMQKFGKGWV